MTVKDNDSMTAFFLDHREQKGDKVKQIHAQRKHSVLFE